MTPSKQYNFGKSVQLGCKIMACLLGFLIVTLPIGIWFWLKAARGRLAFNEGGCQVNGFGLRRTEWRFSDLQRIGLLEVPMPSSAGIGGYIAKMISGGNVAVNLCAVLKNGKREHFMVSRFENPEEIISTLVEKTGLQLETVNRGALGLKWQER